MNIEELQNKIASFAKERDWEQFHTPKNLACALSVESSELLEIFQWMNRNEEENLSSETKHRISEEISDIFVYLVRLADVLNIDLEKSITQKMQQNAEKYPADKVRGSSKKYTEY